MSLSYAKLKNGNWGIRADHALNPGSSVVITKRDQSTKNEIVGELVWSDKGVWLYAIATPARAAAPRAVGRGFSRRSGGGSAASVPGYSSYCTGNEDTCRCYDCCS